MYIPKKKKYYDPPKEVLHCNKDGSLGWKGERYFNENSWRVIKLHEAPTQTIRIALTKSRVAVLIIPTDLTENDIKIIQHYIDGVLLKIQLESHAK